MIGPLLLSAFGRALGVPGFDNDLPFCLETRPVQPPDQGDGIPSAVSTYFVERDQESGQYHLCRRHEVWREGLFGQPVRDGRPMETAYPRTFPFRDAVGWLRAVERLNRADIRQEDPPGILHWSRYENPGPSALFDSVRSASVLHNLTLYGEETPPHMVRGNMAHPR